MAKYVHRDYFLLFFDCIQFIKVWFLQISGQWKPRPELDECTKIDRPSEYTGPREAGPRRKRAIGGQKSLPEDHQYLVLLVFHDPSNGPILLEYSCKALKT